MPVNPVLRSNDHLVQQLSLKGFVDGLEMIISTSPSFVLQLVRVFRSAYCRNPNPGAVSPELGFLTLKGKAGPVVFAAYSVLPYRSRDPLSAREAIVFVRESKDPIRSDLKLSPAELQQIATMLAPEHFAETQKKTDSPFFKNGKELFHCESFDDFLRTIPDGTYFLRSAGKGRGIDFWY
ncbi:MAG: hypothetical protein K2X27_18105 [Candidatus Obscuribacterales bacterium]|nr:hypothetical protein [Candidatus Obscuribacterales bacterium]